MADRETLIYSNAMRRAFNEALLGGVSLLALMMASDLGEARSLLATSAVAPTAVAQQAAIAAAQQAAGAAVQAQASLARAAAALAAARKLQLDAATAAQALPSSVPNGLTTGGLMPAGGTASDPLAGINADGSKWAGADLPKQTTNGSQVTVDINQTQPKAIFYWDTFNVGAKTTVNFNQTGSDWIALNRVLDPSAAPSRILGQINAFGSVYLINRNGIIFGAGSQVDVHTLIASSLDIGLLGKSLGDRDTFFRNIGVANPNSFSIYDAVDGKLTNIVAGDITVERGASIKANVTTDLGALGSPGSVYLFGANVYNSGSITVPSGGPDKAPAAGTTPPPVGEVAMVAARTIDFVPNGYSALPAAVLGTDSSGKLLTLRGTEFRISQFASTYGDNGYSNGPGYLPGTGAVTHDGLIDVPRGIVIMNGDRIAIDNPKDANGGVLRDAAGNLVQGVISVDTSIDRNSMVLLRAATSISMNGVISSLPFDDGAQPLPSGAGAGSTVQSFTPAYIEMSAQSTVTVGSSGLVSAPSARVSVGAVNINHDAGPNLFNQGGNGDVVSSTPQSPQTVLLAPGATIDVAGLENVELPASYNFISFKPLAEFADMPLQRPPYVSVGSDGTGPVYGQTLWIDIRASGTRSDGTSWVGTPLLDASGHVNNVGRSIYQLMTVGGSVSLTTDLGADPGGGSVRTAGSVINVAGGSVKFLPGMVNTTRLLGADGRIYSMANADPNMTYLGIAGQFTVNHSRWGVIETWSTGTQTFAPGYTEGHGAGSVSVTTVNPLLAGGTMYFGSVAGERQISTGALPLQGSLALTTPSSVQIGPAPSADYTTQSASTTLLSADTLSSYGLSAITVTANDFVVSGGSTLNLAPGGSLSVTTGGAIDIAGTVSTAGGAINLVTDRLTVSGKFGSTLKPPISQTDQVIAANVFVEGTLDVSGRFVNDIGRTGTDLSGPAFIDGGTISITTNKSSDSVVGGNADTTGSILLAKGSVLDVSSGGYISPQGKPKTVSTGVMAGKAGSISLAIYQGAQWQPPNQGSPARPDPAVSKVAVLELDGSLRGYGFESNGSLRLAGADTIRIGGSLRPGETSSIRIDGAPSTLPVALLTGGGFGAYTIESITDDWSGSTANVIVSAGTNLTLQQQNLSSLANYSATATGTKLSQQAAPVLALLPDDRRKPVDLALKADNILLDSGSKIVTDPKADITFGSISPNHTLAASDPTRNVLAQNVELRGSIIDHGGNVFVNALNTHLASTALVDLSGTFVANSRFGTVGGPTTSGTYLPGGTFAVEAGQIAQVKTLIDPTNPSNNKYYYAYGAPGAGYLVADTGASVDVSGAAGTVLVAGARGATTSLWSWSDAGTVSADVTGFAWGGSFVAAGGRYLGTDGLAQSDPRANNGTFILGGGSIFLRQDTTDVQSHLSTPQALYVSADQLAPFDNVFLYSGASTGGAARFFNELPAYNRLAGNNVVAEANEVSGSTFNLPANQIISGPLTISGSLNWHVENGLRIAAGAIASDNKAAGSAVTFAAPYVLLASGSGVTPLAGTSTLTIEAQTIDVEAGLRSDPNAPARPLAFSGFSQVNLISTGDIRLSTLKVSNTIDPSTGVSTAPASFQGSLATTGDLLLEAQRIYPVTAVDFTITTPGNVKFAAPAGSNTAIPLAAGGSLTVIANTIDQGGNLFAPLGKITLGNTDSTIPTATAPIITTQVTLEPGSLTSVTLADTIVPYGATLDGINWYYNSSLNPLSQPPSKGLVLAGTNVARSDGSTIDLRGGGDLQAMEWVPGKGGSRDTLTTTPSGQTVYALLPSQSAAVSAFDIQFTAARNAATGNTIAAGDVDPLAGTQITIAGGNGIPAGTYTLYPAHYATLPGAMRVVYYGDNITRNIPTGTRLTDGTVLVTGHYTQSASPAKQSSGQSLFAVQTSSVWQEYSEYGFNGANSYFSQLAAKKNLTVPRLPMDAGRLAVSALQSIVLNGIALTQPGHDASGNIGRGGELDVTAPQLAVVGHAEYVNNDIPAGYVGLDITQLNGFESILIGGLRSDTATGTLITPTATNVVVDTRGEAFTAPEILLVAQTAGKWQELRQWVRVGTDIPTSTQVLVDLASFQPEADSGTVTIKTGSVIETVGTVHGTFGRNYYFAPPDLGQAPAEQVAEALGGTLDPTGTVITGVDLAKLPSYWFWDNYKSFVRETSDNVTSLAFYSYGGATKQQPRLGALFAATNDPTLVVSGPTGVPVDQLTIQFAPVTSGTVPGAPNFVSGPVTGSVTLPAGDGGQTIIEAGTRISTNTVTVQATASVNAIAINTTDLHAKQLNLAAHTVGLGANFPVTDKSLALYDHQFADVQGLTVKALSGAISVYGDFDPGAAVRSLTLDAATLTRPYARGDARIAVGGTLTLLNSGAASAATSDANGSTLDIEATEIDLGGGTQTIAGYSAVKWTATDRVFVAGGGALTLSAGMAAVDLTVTTPNVLVASATGGQSFSVTTSGNVTVADIVARTAAVDRPADSAEIGGSLAIKAASITIGSTIQAQSGKITLEATTGDVILNTGAYIAAGGYTKTLVDATTFVAGGSVLLQADVGGVVTAASTTIDVRQPNIGDLAQTQNGLVVQTQDGLGYGGQIRISATAGRVVLLGDLRGRGGNGLGGSFKVDAGNLGADDVTLDILAGKLLDGGLSGAIDIHTRTGNLELSQGHTLKANAITLTADDTRWDNTDTTKQFGQVIIAGTLDADGYAGNTADGSGQAGGQVGLFGHNAVVLTGTGQILARTTHADERGGDVMIGTAWSASSNIDLQSGSKIDVSGGSKGGLSGGTVTLRAPLDGNNDVKIKSFDATIIGARAVNIQGFVTINTEASPNNLNGIDGSQLTTKDGTRVVWDGFIDPAGSITSNGTLIDFGPWTNVTGEKLNVTPGSGYTAVPTISAVSGGTTTSGTTFVDPTTGATYYQVVDPVTGTTFRSSLQVASITINSGGSYTSAPTVTVTAANGQEPPGWANKAIATAVMTYNDIGITGVKLADSFNGRSVQLRDAAGNFLATGKAVVENGMLTTVNVTSNASVGDLASIHFQGFGILPPDVTSDHFSSVSLRVAAVTLVTGGSGYTGAANISFSGGNASATAIMGGAVTITDVTKGYTGANLPSLTLTSNGSGSGATASFAAQTTGFTGTSDSTHAFVPTPGSNFIPLASSKVFNGTGDSAVVTIVPNVEHELLYTDVLANFVEGHGIQGVGLSGNFGFSGLFDRLNSQNGLVARLGADVVHVQPGIELVNTSNTANSGNITVASNWNLAAGLAGNLQTATNPTSNQSFKYFDPATSYVNFTYRLATPWGGLDAGALTLRAAGNINVNASISDGFFQAGNYLDPNYATWVQSYVGRAIDEKGLYKYVLNSYSSSAVPIAPYNSAANTVSPTAQDLAVADVFPNTLRVCMGDCLASNIKTVTVPGSWSYDFTAGANASSANPNAMIPLASAQAGNTGSVTIDKHATYTQSLIADPTNPINTVAVNLPTMVRTGTGNVMISAALDVVLADTVAPGVIYAAGVNTAKLPDPHYSTQMVNGGSSVVAGNPDGFFEPQVLTYGNGGISLGLYYGPPTAAAFPQQGGDVAIDAQRDIVGYNGSGNKTVQYYQPWLLADTSVTSAASTVAGASVPTVGAGVFTPSGTQIASQSAWWIQYGSFQQGVLSAGGNVAVTAGRDLIDVSVSLPTTGRVSGGLSTASTPVTHIYDSGNMLVRAGRDILGGSFYEGSGRASILAGGSIGQNGTVSRYATSKLMLPDVPLLAVDTGQIVMVAGGSITMAGVVNPAELHVQSSSYANPLETSGSSALLPLYMDTYGPDSKVRLVAETGDLTITIAPTAISDGSNGLSLPSVSATPALYPASFEALALNGSLITTGIQVTQRGLGNGGVVSIPMPGIVLSPSQHGTFTLLAQDSIDLTFGYPQGRSGLLDGTPRPFISAGPALIDAAFDPFQPNSGFDGAFSGALLAHQDDAAVAAAGIDTVARIYAATGDITATGSYGARFKGDTFKGYQRIEINRPTKVYAGRDIVDLNIIVQNIHENDVSTIEAGRNIYYTGYNNGGGLQVAGPGFFVVQAGGDIGPFLPAAHDNTNDALVQQGIASVGNSSPTPVGDIYVTGQGGSIGIYDQALLGPTNNPRRNALLRQPAGTPQGADLITLFGTKFGVDYQAVINAYINPANAANYTFNTAALVNYLKSDVVISFLNSAAGQTALAKTNFNSPKINGAIDRTKLSDFVDQLNNPWLFFAEVLSGQIQRGFVDVGSFLLRFGLLPTDQTSAWDLFQLLRPDLQQVFIDQVFFAELKAVGISQQVGASVQYQRGYQMINTMFPSSLGYTANALGSVTNGANQLVKTGDLNLLHGTIQTQLGGDISIFGPGGNIIVGPLATEPNPNLKLRDLGILTLGGGAINTFTDESVLVNSSRILTTQGGDVLMWSSNGDLDAGRGSKTITSAPALQVLFDQNDYQSIDLGGFVTGSGFGTLQASSVALSANVYPIAPRGKVDFGTAGVRSSGDLVVIAPVVLNQGNSDVKGSTTGVSVVAVPNVGALAAGSNTAGAATKSADTPTAAGGNGDRASVFIVEVVGYGGGDTQGQPSSGSDDTKRSDERKP